MFGRATIRLGIGPHSSFSRVRLLSVALVHQREAFGIIETGFFVIPDAILSSNHQSVAAELIRRVAIWRIT